MTHQQPSRRCSHLVPPKLLRRGRSCPSEASQEARPLPTRPPAGLVRKLRLRPWSVRIREGEEAQLRWGLTGPPASPPQPPHGPGRRQASRVPGTLYRHAPRTPEVSAAAARCPQTMLLPGTALPSEGWGRGAGRAACTRGHTPTPRKAHPRTRHRTSYARADVTARGASTGPSDKGLTVPTAEPRPDTHQLCRNPALSTARADRGAAVPRRPGRHRSERTAAGRPEPCAPRAEVSVRPGRPAGYAQRKALAGPRALPGSPTQHPCKRRTRLV